jgi:UDP-N-acetylmuramyl pentapeptide phosphotransferase/UDP-N-acetylglucosamine-1-phosphate transferase
MKKDVLWWAGVVAIVVLVVLGLTDDSWSYEMGPRGTASVMGGLMMVAMLGVLCGTHSR